MNSDLGEGSVLSPALMYTPRAFRSAAFLAMLLRNPVRSAA